jgi:hypothetical protein
MEEKGKAPSRTTQVRIATAKHDRVGPARLPLPCLGSGAHPVLLSTGLPGGKTPLTNGGRSGKWGANADCELTAAPVWAASNERSNHG